MERVEVSFLLSEENDKDLQLVMDNLKEAGVEATVPPAERALPVLPVVLAVMAVVAAARAIADLACRFRSGVIVDVRPRPVSVKKEPNLPTGKIVLVDARGAVSVQNCGHDDLKDLINAALQASG